MPRCSANVLHRLTTAQIISCPVTKAAKARRPSSASTRTSWTSSFRQVVSVGASTPCTTFTRATDSGAARNLSPLARDTGLGTAALDSFGRGEGSMPPETLNVLARELLDAEYDAAADLLRPRRKTPPRALGVRPPPLDPETLPKFELGPRRGPQPVKTAPPPPPKAQRAGWVE